MYLLILHRMTNTPRDLRHLGAVAELSEQRPGRRRRLPVQRGHPQLRGQRREEYLVENEAAVPLAEIKGREYQPGRHEAERVERAARRCEVGRSVVPVGPMAVIASLA